MEGRTKACVNHEELHGGAYRGPDSRGLQIPTGELHRRLSPSEPSEAAVAGAKCGGGFEVWRGAASR